MRTCLGSGRVQIASRSAAGRCEPNPTGVVHLVMLTLLLGMTTKGKVPKAPWVVLLRKDPALCRPRPALGHTLCRTVDASVASSAGHTWKLYTTFTSPSYLAVLVRCLGVLFMVQCLVQQWIHALRQLLVLLDSYPEVDSRPALLGPRSLEKCAQFMLQVARAAAL